MLRLPLIAVVATAVLLSACGSGGPGTGPTATTSPPDQAAASAAEEPSTPVSRAAAPGEAAAEGSDAAPGERRDDGEDEGGAVDDADGDGGGGTRPPSGPAAADALAGVLERTVPASGSGRTEVVQGAESAPRDGRLQRVRVEVEGGLPVDGAAFAAMVMTTLNDPRSWPSQGWSFARTDGDADVVVRLASPELSERLCHPLRTRGTLSCRSSEGVILTHHRWVKGQEDYGDDLTGYRRYVVNHEVGHALGQGHVGCPSAGALAPVMQQQTIDVDPCRPNPWVEP